MDSYQSAAPVAKKPLFTVKNVLRVLELLCVVFVFCPVFLVSCTSQTIDVSVMTAVGGLETSYGDTVVEPHLIMLLCLFIPIAGLVLLFLKKFPEKRTALIVLVCTVIDFILWLVFRSETIKIAEENGCTFEATAWFYMNMLALLAIVVLTALVMASVLALNADLTSASTTAAGGEALNQLSSVVGQVQQSVVKLSGDVAASLGKNNAPQPDIMGYCIKCGAPLIYGNKFCMSCGTPVSPDVLAAAEAAHAAAAAAAVCPGCGAPREANAQFCGVCGTPYAAPPPAAPVAPPSVCPTCGSPLVPGNKFCMKCGTKIL